MKIVILCLKKSRDAFIEYINSIKKYVCFDVCYYENQIDIHDYFMDDTITKIFIHKIYSKLKTNKNVYLLNTEQLSSINHFDRTIGKFVLDYSPENIKINENQTIFFPYGINNKEIYNYDKIYDICFVGRMTKRRSNFLNKLKNYNIKIINNIWDNERDELLFRCKILINIHGFDNYNIYESIRCDRCVFNKMIVISEESLFPDLVMLKDKIIMCKYDEIIEKTIDVLNNYEKYYGELFDDYDHFMTTYSQIINDIYEENIKYLL